jgi:hypothetical protein
MPRPNGDKPEDEPDAPDMDAELDEALEETFPASDPIAPMQKRHED